jgi:hypothetical protein
MDRVSPTVETGLRELAEQVRILLRLVGIPAMVDNFEDPVVGASIAVDPIDPGFGVYVDWSTPENVLRFEAKAARARQDWYNPVYQFYGDLGDSIMPDAIAKVLEAAGLQVTRLDHQVKVLGEFPEHIKALIEA